MGKEKQKIIINLIGREFTKVSCDGMGKLIVLERRNGSALKFKGTIWKLCKFFVRGKSRLAFQFRKNQFNVRCDEISPRPPPLPISPFQLHIKLHKSSSPRGLQYFLRQQFCNSLHCSSLYVHKHLLHEASLPKL